MQLFNMSPNNITHVLKWNLFAFVLISERKWWITFRSVTWNRACVCKSSQVRIFNWKYCIYFSIVSFGVQYFYIFLLKPMKYRPHSLHWSTLWTQSTWKMQQCQHRRRKITLIPTSTLRYISVYLNHSQTG